MSPSQQGMYFDSQLREASDYHVALHLRMEPVVPARFEAAVRQVVAEQPALRSAVRNTRGGLSYVVAESVDPPVSFHDLRGRGKELDAIAAEANRTPFSLDEAPLFRIVHCKLADEDRAIIVCHHLVADGQSVSLLAERVISLARGRADIEGPAGVDAGFHIYQEKQNKPLPPKKEARHRTFWQENLEVQDAPDLSHWMHSETAYTVGKEFRLPLDGTLREALGASAREIEVSEYTLYLGAFGLLLGHYAHTDHVSVATPFADRPSAEMEDSIGCFIKTLPVHIDVEPTQTLRTMFERLSKQILGTWKHLGYPMAKHIADQPSLNRVYDVTFIQDTYPAYPQGVLGTARQDRVHFPGKLTVIVEQIGDGCELVFQYKESALSEDKVFRLARRYLTLLARIPEWLDSPVRDVQPTMEPETADLLASLSRTHYYDWEPAHLGSLFVEKTRQDPARVAWSDETRRYSNAWAHDAAALIQRRVAKVLDGEKQAVAVMLPRSVSLLAGVFGTVMAGGAYVPMSENTPTQRLAQIIEDASIGVVLTASAVQVELPDGVTRLNIDEWEELEALRTDERTEIQEEPLDIDVAADDVLYIEYTSGSTGQPKGVVVRHANIQNTAMDLERRFPLGPDDVYLLKTAFTFDIFGTEIYGWLFGEGRLDVLPVGHEGDALALLRAIAERGITHINFSPTMLRVLLDAAASNNRADDLASLQYVFSGGEALTADIAERFFNLELDCSLENVYGPTEASMWATHSTVTAGDSDAIAPIGTPLNDYRVYILNSGDGLCGVEIPGEVCIAGAGVAVGYLNRDELNATQFVTNPFYDPATDPEHMQRMYRTGDLGYLRSDGRFAFIRRIDRQVKVGGVRMELGEVEQALLRADGVVEAAVVIDDDVTPPRLAGFFTADGSVSIDTVRATLAQSLMPHMVPSLLFKLDSLPTSSAGKLDQRALKEHLSRSRSAGLTTKATQSPIQERIAGLWRKVLGTENIDADGSFFEQGGNSLNLMSLQLELQEEFGREIRITELLKHHSVVAQARLFGDVKQEVAVTRQRVQPAGDIAIIGIGIQVPGAGDVHSFWTNLQQGRETIKFYDDEELRNLGVPDSDLRDPSYVKAKGRLEDINVFDDELFPIPPAEVDVTSPQLRLLYKCFWQACEDAGYDPRQLPGRIGVFTGGSDDFAWYQKTLLNSSAFGDVYQNFTLATNHFLSTRLSYYFDLTGPSMSTLAGCSTSLLTVHQAAQSLRAGECDMAVAGGVTIELPNEGGYRYVDGMMLSPDGHCRPFDANAGGTMFSNGAALLMLKPVEAAVADGDPIYAVIKGSAIGNDGKRKLSYTAPSEDGQYETIRAAYDASGIDPSTVTYVEAHGTGTLLGDPIEVASLSRAFDGAPLGGCLLGSVKGNVGHTDSAAGSVGLSKVALSLKNRYVPATCNYEKPNPNIDFESTPFTIAADGRVWRGERLRAGINSFGVGGTNVHMILEEAPSTDMTDDNPYELLQFSAATSEALERTSERVGRYIADRDEVSLSDAALTLRAGRAELPHRKTIVVAAGESREDLEAKIAAAGSAKSIRGAKIALLFSGQGNQYHRMGFDLYNSSGPAGRVFRRWMDELIGYLPDDEAATFTEIMYGDESDGRIDRTEWSQFALFSTQYSMAKVLESYGVRPDVLIGHSIGELTAAALADVWSLADAAWLVRQRGKLMQSQTPGVMVAALAPADRVRRVINGMDDVWVSLDNSSERSVLGMTFEMFDAVMDRLAEEGIRGSKLHTSHAFHTPMMTDAAQAFEAVVSGVESRDPSIPIISNRSGRAVEPGAMINPAYWSEHITDEVRFAESLSTLLADGPLFGIELGPGRSLATFAGHDPQRTPDQVFVNVLRHAAESTPDEPYLLAALGKLWNIGLSLDWSHHNRGRRISLPGYVFDKTVYAVDTEIVTEQASAPKKPAVSNAAPGGTLESFCDAFRHVLGHKEVSADDDFFALGGDSLKATGLSAHLESRAGIAVTVADIFASPTPGALAERFQKVDASGSILKAPAAEHHPLSPAQTRMYIAAKMDPQALIYNMPSATLLHGRLDPERVRVALRRLVERHEPLRTNFVMRDGEVRQIIADPETVSTLPLRFTQGDHGGVGAVDALMTEFVKPFDLENEQLFRMELVDDGNNRHLLLFDIHHIVADAVSVEVITRDFSSLYVGELEPLELQYTDFVMHVRGDEHREALAESEKDLLAALDGAPTVDLLAPDHPRGEREPAAGRVIMQFDRDCVSGVKSLAEKHSATPFMVMLSTWGALFSRYADCSDVVIGAPVTGRTMAETQEMIGMFVNMMPIRLRPEAASSFGDYLAASRVSVLEALTHQDVPFDQLVEKLNLRRTVGRHPLFDISFDYHNMDHHEVQIDGITAQQLDIAPLAVGMDLVITCMETADGLTVHVDYAADLFDATTIEELAHHFEALLNRVCADDSLTLAEFPVHANRQHDAIRSRLNGKPFQAIHEVIEKHATETPEATAVIDASGERYTYAQINGMANAQAARLLSAGIKVGDPVALFAVRDVNLLIAQLAILKAGGAYVPLDPAQPQTRHERIIADMNPRFAFAPADLAATASIETVVDIGTCTQTSAPTLDNAPKVGPDDLIYIVYTSGSTGTPKGIAVKHRGVFNLFCDHTQRSLFGPGDVIISLADPTFDIFTFESLIPLASGAGVHMCPAEDQKDATAIGDRIAAHSVTHIQVPVSKMAALCGNRRFRTQLGSLRVIVCGGEHFSENLLSLLQEETSARIFNMYGPTETTVTATVKEFALGDEITIGSAIFGTEVLVVDENGMMLPDGVTGELCIAGEGLAWGYLNNPEETRRAFTRIAELPDVPVYRTGDAGARLPNRDIVLKGRLDHQVKFNGNRIELGEIEQTAMRADKVTYAVAAVEDDSLVLYYSSADSSDVAAAITTQIAEALPAYMKPERFHRVHEMPKLPNNKIDRNALRNLRREKAASGTHTEPAGDILGRILQAWEIVLGHSARADDNFFDIGGNSYKLMLVNNHLGEMLQMDVPLVKLFENPTPRSLAESLGYSPTSTGTSTGQPRPAHVSTPVTEDPINGEAITMDDLAGFDDWVADDAPAPQPSSSGDQKIAVIGMAGVLPGAADITTHWDNRADGVVSISRFTKEEMLDAGVDEETVNDPRYVNARGFVDASTFDADFFGYSARDAETMDPQMRLLHETTWHALEDAGYVPNDYPGDIALFVGSGTNFAWMAGFLNRHDDPIGAFEAMTMNEKDFLATKIAYKLDLTGPAVNVQTACSTSLVAIHKAVQSLRQGEADMALAGGVALNFPRKEGYTWHEGMIFSKDGVCRPFSGDADGTVGGQGCGVVLLKPLDRALADGDHVYAVIVGTATNNDGKNKVGYSAPSVRGQRQVIEAALADAGAEAGEIGYVETHGTGTKLGDPIEYEALSAVYGKSRPCALGAVKANIGHLDSAAGVAGFIGAVGVLHRGFLPPMANFRELNENIDGSSLLYIPTDETVTEQRVRMAAVSSFGIGGTNAHVILESAPALPQEPDDDGVQHIFPVSARTEKSRRSMQKSLETFYAQGHRGRDISHTLARGRAEFVSRAAAVAGPGRSLTWIEPTDPPLTINASDSLRLASKELLSGETTLGGDFRKTIERELRVFDDGLRETLWKALSDEPSANLAIDRISQFVIRVALIRVIGDGGLDARSGENRLLRIARAFAHGEIGPAEAMRFLKSGTVPAGNFDGAEQVSNLVDDLIDEQLLNRILASQWVHGGEVDRIRFCREGRRLPIPGYVFDDRPFVSDIKLNELVRGAVSAPKPAVEGTRDVLHDAWVEVLGSPPAEDDDFLRCGGDSLSAVHFCALIEERSGVSLSVTEVFADARYSAIRRLMADKGGAAPAPAEVAIPVVSEPQIDAEEPAPSVAPISPASPAQKRMYAVCAMQEDTTAYNLAISYKVTGRLDVELMRNVFGRLVERHDQLRTSFHLDGGELMQHVHPVVADVVSHTTATPEQVEERLAAGARPFDLSTAPLMRVEILTVSEDLHYLLIDMHHIIGDQRSLAILAEDIAAALQNEPLPAVPMRYAEYVEALSRLKDSGRFEEDTEFFTAMLAGEIPRLELPTDTTPAQPATFDGDRHSFVCTAGRQAIADIAKQCDVTPYMVFLTALTRLLSLYGGRSEFVIGTALSGRSVPGSDRTVGMFVNTLPLRVTDVSDRTVRQAVTASKDIVLSVLSHQHAPFESVLSALDIQPGGDSNPLFDVLFNYVNVGTEELQLGGLTLEPLPPGRVKSRYALSVSVAERADDFSVDIEYRTELFHPHTIARIAEQLDRLLVAMAADADRPIAMLSLESREEHDRRRAALTAAGPKIDESLLERVRESFGRHAAMPALRWQQREWTYAEVDAVTDALAGGLQESGVGQGDFVLCLMDRGPWQVFARIAIMKCGAVEVPLDVKTPDERIALILADSGAEVVLSDDPQSHPWPEGVLACGPEQLTGTYRAPGDITAQTPIVMIYTSGTTGQPKGTLVTGGGVLSTSIDNGYTDYRPGQRVLHLTGYTFDPSLLDVYSAFLSGATLVMGEQMLNMDMRLLADFLRTERIDCGILITAVFHLLMAENPNAVAGMTALYVGGEALQPWAAKKAFDVLGPGRLYNLYGPTEASVCTTYYRVDESPDFPRMPIGVPAHNRELYIVHPDGTDVPRGVPGELCVAGPSVAVGYHKRPEMTAEKFVDGLGTVTGRLYRTGDRVVLDDADRIVYIDRVDQQIKHAGYRIELSEIELVLQGRPTVTAAVVIHTTDRNDSQLTAFYSGESAPTEAEMREMLLAKLPRYMVPQRLVRMPELPLTSHGKVDRKRLAATVERGDTPTERSDQADPVVLAAFREALSMPELSAADDFFEAGAQSIQAIAVVRRLREAGVDLQVSDVYRHPTAEALTAATRPVATTTPPPVQEKPRRALPPEQVRRMVGWATDDSRRVGQAFALEPAEYTFETGAVAKLHRASGAETGGFMHTLTGVGVEDLAEAITALVVRHEVLRARLNEDRLEVLGPDAFENLSTLLCVQDLRRLDRSQVQEFVDAAAHALQADSFDDGLLWRCVIVRESEDALRLMWAFHHSVFDGFSAGILRDEVTRLLRGEKLRDAQRYSDFAGMGTTPDWSTELAEFDYSGWLDSNRIVTEAVRDTTDVPIQRLSYPLNGENPLNVALTTVHARLAAIGGHDRVAVGVVNDCRRWMGEDYSDCVGEFLDVVPVLLEGAGDQPKMADRMAAAQRRGLHYMDSLAAWSGDDEILNALKSSYCDENGKLRMTLLNFQGYIAPGDMPKDSTEGPTLAPAHVNVWHDDESLHLEWITEQPQDAAGA